MSDYELLSIVLQILLIVVGIVHVFMDSKR